MLSTDTTVLVSMASTLTDVLLANQPWLHLVLYLDNKRTDLAAGAPAVYVWVLKLKGFRGVSVPGLSPGELLCVVGLKVEVRGVSMDCDMEPKWLVSGLRERGS